MLERNLQEKVIAYLKSRRIYYTNAFGSGFGSKGTPDLTLCINGRYVALELKVNDNSMSNAQKIHKQRIERSGGLHFTPYTLAEAIEIIESIERLRD